ncbi:hypothetical protein NM688_g1156 [Phlebia brevispora]|uniref:Uncharacterized protein n=1 Tax=Phlebia brevispora TaxID=194682 RepID=A0ACC1TCE3_9APHY|nr:hypothetical protein NM688_g1156 [Phlebia brevispora]
MMPNTHEEIIQQLPVKFEKAREAGDLFFFPSTTHKHAAHGIEFEIKLCPALQNKPTLPTPHFDADADERRAILEGEGKRHDPFAPPYIPNLLLGDLKDEEGEEYVVLFNKFSIVPHHILLITKEFHSQAAPLMPPDLVQTYKFLLAAQKAGRKFFAFYNCGDMSGASQPHKHLQLIPLEEDGPPVEKLARIKTLEFLERPFALEELPYANHVRRLPPYLPNAAPEELEDTLARVFLSLLDLAVSTYRRDPTPDSVPQSTRAFKSAISYNVLLTLEHMHVIPRKLETYTLKETGETLSINAMGFAGCLLVKSEQELDAVLKEGVVTRQERFQLDYGLTSTLEMANVLDDKPKLPPELLRIVKELIPIADLRTHVCYYNTCRTFASFYGKPEEEEEFWKKSCIMCGICSLGDQSWKEIAFECITKDGFCTHPACGGALLEWNGEVHPPVREISLTMYTAEQVANAMQKVPKWTPDEVISAKLLGLDTNDFHESIFEDGTVVPSKVFNYVGYSPRLSSHAEDPEKDAFIRYPNTQPARRSPLYDHPIARRSLATFPSFARVLYWGVGLDDSQVGTEGGYESPVTVWDIQNITREELEGELGYENLMYMAKDQYPHILDGEGKLKKLPLQDTEGERDADASEDGEGQATFRDIWSRCKFKFRVGNVYIGDIGDVTVDLQALLGAWKALDTSATKPEEQA